MKKLSLLVWVTQFGLSAIVPLCGALLVSSWLGFGPWGTVLCAVLGLLTSFSTARSCLRAMRREAQQEQAQPPVAFNEHD